MSTTKKRKASDTSESETDSESETGTEEEVITFTQKQLDRILKVYYKVEHESCYTEDTDERRETLIKWMLKTGSGFDIEEFEGYGSSSD